jgi:hypothetical protein
MPFVIVQHRLKDYDAWKPVFDEHQAARKQHGGCLLRVLSVT